MNIISLLGQLHQYESVFFEPLPHKQFITERGFTERNNTVSIL